MTDELRDYTTPAGWTRADTDALLDAALACAPWDDDTAFLPLDPAEAERRADMNRVGRTITQAQLDKALNEMYPTTFRWRMPFPLEGP